MTSRDVQVARAAAAAAAEIAKVAGKSTDEIAELAADAAEVAMNPSTTPFVYSFCIKQFKETENP